jgi:hypothetical protein
MYVYVTRIKEQVEKRQKKIHGLHQISVHKEKEMQQ